MSMAGSSGWNMGAWHLVAVPQFAGHAGATQSAPVFVPAQEELWIYRDAGGVRSAKVGSAIRYSFFPAPLHYLQLFLRPSFLLTIDVRDWLKLLHVWSC